MFSLKILGKISIPLVLALFFAGCSLSYSVKDPVPSSIQYNGNVVEPQTLTIVDQRTGNDSVFLVKHLGPDGSASDDIDLQIANIEDPIGYFANQLEKELKKRKLPIKCVVGKGSDGELTLVIDRYQIFNQRATAFSPWEACHIFSGAITDGHTEKPIKVYFYNGKVPVWSMTEVEKPCFSIPISIVIKEVASKICREAFGLRSPDEKVEELRGVIDAENKKEDKDPYDRPFWKVLELGYTNNPKAMKPLEKYAQDGDEFFSSCALSAMGVLGAGGQIEFLMQKYKTGSFNDRYMAAKAIGDVGTQKAIAILYNMKKDPAYINEQGLKQCLDLYAP